MRAAISTLMILLLICGCRSKHDDYKSIELMAYNWSYRQEQSIKSAPLHIQCYRYVIIDNDGVGDVYQRIGYPNVKVLYNRMSIRKGLIDSILATVVLGEEHPKLKPLSECPPMIYDGPTFRIKVTYADGRSKSIGLIRDYEEGNNGSILKLCHLFDSISVSKNIELSKDSAFIKRRLEYIQFAMHQDSLISFFPFAPPPPPDSIATITFVAPPY